jgi:hypothetical protein
MQVQKEKHTLEKSEIHTKKFAIAPLNPYTINRYNSNIQDILDILDSTELYIQNNYSGTTMSYVTTFK